MNLTRLWPLVPLAIILATSAAHGAAPPAIRTLEIEILDATKSTNDTTRFALAIDGPKSTKLSVPAGDLSYQLDARCESPTAGMIPITISIHRGDHRPGSPLRLDFDSALSVPIGVRTVVVAAARPDGSKVEIAVRAH